MTRKGLALGAALGALAMVDVSAGEPAAESRDRPHRVLFIHAFEPGLPADAAFTSGLRSTLLLRGEVALFSEHLDRERFPQPTYVEEFRGWIRTKYAHRPPDVIVAAGPAAAEFLADPATTPFPGVPVVFGMVGEGRLPVERLPPNSIGLLEQYAFRETLALALALFPETEHVALAGGASSQDLAFNELVRREAAAAAPRLEVIPLLGLSMTDLQDRLRRLPPRTVVLLGTMLEDGAGRQWAWPQVVPVMASTSSAPIFTVFGTVFGFGVVGGVLTDFEDSGRIVAGIVRRVLAGEPAEAIPVRRHAGRALLDGRQLRRWSVPDARVPASAEVRFREPTPWQRFRWQFLATGSALVIQALLIAGLLIERRNRRAAERDVREKLVQIAHMNRVGTVGELTGSFAHELNTPLGAALNNAQAARRFLFREPFDRGEVMACLEDIVSDVRRAGDVVQRMRGALRREDAHRGEIHVSRLIRDAVRLVEAEAQDRDVALAIVVEDGLPTLVGDDVQLVQVVLNLVVNAMDALAAMPKERRRIGIRAAPVSRGAAIEVSDTGPGIPLAQLEKVFEPFFTTKASGLGLGLAISRSIVMAHGGTITAAAAEGGGTVFRVYLPAAEAPAAAQSAAG